MEDQGIQEALKAKVILRNYLNNGGAAEELAQMRVLQIHLILSLLQFVGLTNMGLKEALKMGKIREFFTQGQLMASFLTVLELIRTVQMMPINTSFILKY